MPFTLITQRLQCGPSPVTVVRINDAIHQLSHRGLGWAELASARVVHVRAHAYTCVVCARTCVCEYVCVYLCMRVRVHVACVFVCTSRMLRVITPRGFPGLRSVQLRRPEEGCCQNVENQLCHLAATATATAAYDACSQQRGSLHWEARDGTHEF